MQVYSLTARLCEVLLIISVVSCSHEPGERQRVRERAAVLAGAGRADVLLRAGRRRAAAAARGSSLAARLFPG